jgi:hypothetical protein
MSLLGNEVFLSVIIGIIGALTRLAVQLIRDGELDQSTAKSGALLFLGAVGGGIAYLISGYVPLASLALGFSASDVIENLLGNYLPS